MFYDERIQKEKWHIKAIKNFFLENKYHTRGAVFVSLCFVFWYVVTDNVFVRRTYESVPDPVLTLRMLSGIIFGALGAFLYNTKVYLFFYNLLPKKDLEAFRGALWHAMMFLIGFVIIPGTINIANAIPSFVFNMFGLIFWLFPVLGIPMIVFLFWFWIKKLWSQ